MSFKIGKLLEKGKINIKGLVSILHSHEKRIDDLENGESGELIDISALKETVGDADGGLVKSVADLTTAVGGKADSSHTHTISNISDATTSAITITYTDDTTATLTFVVQDSS